MDQKYLQEGFELTLAHALEECGEFIAAAGKTQRWGPWSSNPELPAEAQEMNILWLEREMNDVLETMTRFKHELTMLKNDNGL